MKFGELTCREIREKALAGWLAVVPTGSTEPQGPHLPVDFETWFVEMLCTAAAERAVLHGAKVLVLPALPFDPTPAHRGSDSGYIHLPQDSHARVITAVLNSLAEQGFCRIIIWRGSEAQALRSVVTTFNAAHAGRAMAYLPDLPYAEICRQLVPGVTGGYAALFATAISLYLRPDSVRATHVSAAGLNSGTGADWSDLEAEFSRSAALVSPQLGEQLWQSAVESTALALAGVAVGASGGGTLA